MEPQTSESLPHGKYWAFISYSHKDAAWAKWLQNSIEKYYIPQRLVGKTSRDGLIPRKLFPLFRDAAELAASGDLNHQIRDALYSSRNLIVVCSPTAARSKWVEEEIRVFKTFGRTDRVLALIVEGEPNISPCKEPLELECFPTGLRYSVGSNGVITNQRVEPLAADVRKKAGGPRTAMLRLVAGILNLSFDDLKRRDQQRQFYRRVISTAAGVIILLIVGGS